MAPSALVTEPLPDNATDNGNRGAKLAVTDWLELIVTLHGALVVQAPLQPVKTEFGPGVAARPITVPEARLGSEQLVAQFVMTPSELVTVPVAPPVPKVVADSVNSGRNLAVTEVFALTVTVQVPVPAQEEPLQPAKTVLALVGAAVKVTLVPDVYERVQVPEVQFNGPVGLVT